MFPHTPGIHPAAYLFISSLVQSRANLCLGMKSRLCSMLSTRNAPREPGILSDRAVGMPGAKSTGEWVKRLSVWLGHLWDPLVMPQVRQVGLGSEEPAVPGPGTEVANAG